MMTTGDKAELLPCPFCGPMPAKPEVWRDHHGYVRVIHGPCGSSTGTRPKSDPDGEAKVIAVWNTRAQAAGVSGVPEDVDFRRLFDTTGATESFLDDTRCMTFEQFKTSIKMAIKPMSVPDGWKIQRKHGHIVVSHPDHGGTVCGLELENVPDQILEALCADLLAAAPER